MGKIVVVAASFGGVAALARIVSGLSGPCGATFLVVLHIGALPSLLPDILGQVTTLPVTHAVDGAPIEPGHIYVAPPDRHMLVEPGRVRLSTGPKVKHTGPAADPLFTSAAEAYGSSVVGIVLTGWDGDGAEGLRAIKEHGGLAIVQDPSKALASEMPAHAIAADHPDLCLSLDEIAAKLREFCKVDQME